MRAVRAAKTSPTAARANWPSGACSSPSGTSRTRSRSRANCRSTPRAICSRRAARPRPSPGSSRRATFRTMCTGRRSGRPGDGCAAALDAERYLTEHAEEPGLTADLASEPPPGRWWPPLENLRPDPVLFARQRRGEALPRRENRLSPRPHGRPARPRSSRASETAHARRRPDAGLHDPFAARLAHLALPGADQSGRGRTHPRRRAARHHRIGRPLPDRLEGAGFRRGAGHPGGRILPFALSRGVFPQHGSKFFGRDGDARWSWTSRGATCARFTAGSRVRSCRARRWARCWRTGACTTWPPSISASIPPSSIPATVPRIPPAPNSSCRRA